MIKIDYLSDAQKLRLRIVETMGNRLLEGGGMGYIPMLDGMPIKFPNQTIHQLAEIEKYILEGYT